MSEQRDGERLSIPDGESYTDWWTQWKATCKAIDERLAIAKQNQPVNQRRFFNGKKDKRK